MAMLVLSRKKNESIIINDHITVTVVEIRGDKVRLGIDAPREVSVHRREVYEAIQRENKKAAQIQIDEARQIGRAPGERKYRTKSNIRPLPVVPLVPNLVYSAGQNPGEPRKAPNFTR